MTPHLYPLPARCTHVVCTGAGRGQGEGQVPLGMTGVGTTEKSVSWCTSRLLFMQLCGLVFLRLALRREIPLLPRNAVFIRAAMDFDWPGKVAVRRRGGCLPFQGRRLPWIVLRR